MRTLLPALALLAAASPLRAQDANYRKDVQPLLRERCYACHGVLQQKHSVYSGPCEDEPPWLCQSS